jgi:aspartate/methionine/tyrosine aminotransferase
MEVTLKPGSIFRQAKDIGVIWATEEAAKLGFRSGDPDWVNLGQGEPEVGELKNGSPRVTTFSSEPEDFRYGPVNGMEALRKAIAEHYNRIYRKEKTSRYTSQNVSIVMGGRLALTRIFCSMGTIRLGYKTPEYPAYEDLLNYQAGRITPVKISTTENNNFAIPPAEFAAAITNHKLDAFLFSNPCNPTGHVVRELALKSYLRTAKEKHCALIVDEVYSHYIYESGSSSGKPVSAAEFVEDVEEDQVLIVDGLTKSFRCPGWRLAWVLGPKDMIEDLGRASSGIDGGPSLPIQRAALQMLKPQWVDPEMAALRSVFQKKQTLMMQSLRQNGMRCSVDANSTFYVWADISKLPAPLNNADTFFDAMLRKKVITIPGYIFDIHPGLHRKETQFKQYIRLSFGPEEENLKKGLDRISSLINSDR